MICNDVFGAPVCSRVCIRERTNIDAFLIAGGEVSSICESLRPSLSVLAFDALSIGIREDTPADNTEEFLDPCPSLALILLSAIGKRGAFSRSISCDRAPVSFCARAHPAQSNA